MCSNYFKVANLKQTVEKLIMRIIVHLSFLKFLSFFNQPIIIIIIIIVCLFYSTAFAWISGEETRAEDIPAASTGSREVNNCEVLEWSMLYMDKLDAKYLYI